MTSYLLGKLFSDCSPLVFRFLVKFRWRKVHYWKINIKFQRDYKSNQTESFPTTIGTSKTFLPLYNITNIIPFYFFDYIGYHKYCTILSKDTISVVSWSFFHLDGECFKIITLLATVIVIGFLYEMASVIIRVIFY